MLQTKSVVKSSEIWTAECQSYQFFSAMLQRNLISAKDVNLTFTPMEYLQQIDNCSVQEDGKGYINLLVMLFSEYYQQHETGRFKINFNEEKYQLIAKQFLILIRLELKRRLKPLYSVKVDYLFNPNIKTTFIFSSDEHISDEIKYEIKNKIDSVFAVVKYIT